MEVLATVLADVSKSEVSRMAAGLQLKNYLTSKDAEIRLQYQGRWLKIDQGRRKHIKDLVGFLYVCGEALNICVGRY